MTNAKETSMNDSRRQAFQKLLSFFAASPLMRAQKDLDYKPEHLPGIDQW